jgi:hypothetical protein
MSERRDIAADKEALKVILAKPLRWKLVERDIPLRSTSTDPTEVERYVEEASANLIPFVEFSAYALPHYLSRCEEVETALEAAIDHIAAEVVCTSPMHGSSVCQRSNGDCHECYGELFMRQGKEAVKHV